MNRLFSLTRKGATALLILALAAAAAGCGGGGKGKDGGGDGGADLKNGKTKFQEGMLFTHRGLSGPSILQISSYWREGDEIRVDMAPGVDALATLKAARTATPRRAASTVLATLLPQRVALPTRCE